VHSNVLTNISPSDDLLVQNSSSAPLELVVALLLGTLVGRPQVPHQRRLVLCDDADVDVAAGAQVVPDAGLDGGGAQVDGLVLGHVLLPLGLEDGHGGQGAGAHGHVGELVRAAVRVHGEEVAACGVTAGDDEVGANVALVAEQVLLEHGHDGGHAGFPAGGQGVQFDVGGDEGGGEFCVGGRACAGAPDLGGYVVELLAVLFGKLSVWI